MGKIEIDMEEMYEIYKRIQCEEKNRKGDDETINDTDLRDIVKIGVERHLMYKMSDKCLVNDNKKTRFLNGTLIYEGEFEKLNETTKMVECVWKVTSSGAFYIKEPLSSNRKMFNCIADFLKKIGGDEKLSELYMIGKGKSYYFEAREYEFCDPYFRYSEPNQYEKISELDCLLKDFYKSRKDMVFNEDFSLFSYYKIWDFFRASIPAFDKNGKVKLFQEYVKDINFLDEVFDKYINEKEDIYAKKMDMLLDWLSPKKKEEIMRTFCEKKDGKSLSEARKLFCQWIVEEHMRAIDDLDSIAKRYVNWIRCLNPQDDDGYYECFSCATTEKKGHIRM